MPACEPSWASDGYMAWAAELMDKAAEMRIPIHGELELTYRCNYACKHCYCNEAAGDKEVKSREMTTAQVLSALDQLRDAGCLWLLITGGEAMLRPDFKEIWVHAKRLGFLLTLYTNGSMIDEAMADFLAEYPPFRIEISLYGATPKTYEAVTGLPGSFERCWRGIMALARHGIGIHLKAAVMEDNKAELEAMRSQALELDDEFGFDPVIVPRIDGTRRVIPCRVPASEIAAWDASDAARAGAWSQLHERYDVNRASAEERRSLFSCAAGQAAVNINPYGEAGVCNTVTWSKVSLKDKSFRDIWENDLRRHRQGSLPEGSPCAVCEIAHFCDVCPAWRSLEGVGPHDPIQFLCELAKGRNARFGGPSLRCGAEMTGHRFDQAQSWEV